MRALISVQCHSRCHGPNFIQIWRLSGPRYVAVHLRMLEPSESKFLQEVRRRGPDVVDEMREQYVMSTEYVTKKRAEAGLGADVPIFVGTFLLFSPVGTNLTRLSDLASTNAVVTVPWHGLDPAARPLFVLIGVRLCPNWKTMQAQTTSGLHSPRRLSLRLAPGASPPRTTRC